MRCNPVASTRTDPTPDRWDFPLKLPRADLHSAWIDRFSAAPSCPSEKMVGYLSFEAALDRSTHQPAVLLVGGSEGGIDREINHLIAAEGYVALTVGYHQGCSSALGFGGMPSELEDRLPADLVNVPLEGFIEAYSWLSSLPFVDSNRIALSGISRGGELALILASHFPEAFKGVAALVPNSYVICGYSPNADRAAVIAQDGTPAWTLAGKPYGATPVDEYRTFGPIALDQIKARVFAVSGQLDSVWADGCPDADYWWLNAEKITGQLGSWAGGKPHMSKHYKDNGHHFPLRQRWAPDEGELAFSSAQARLRGAGGASAERTLEVGEEVWRGVIQFLGETIRP